MRIQRQASTSLGGRFCCVLLIMVVTLTKSSLGFIIRPGLVSRLADGACRSKDSIELGMDFFAEDVSVASDFKAANNKKKQDPLAPFDVGTVVRIKAEGIKAYHVSKSAFGFYDDDKNFVLEEAGGNAYLQLPVGMRGVVQKVYNKDELSANFPIQVNFEPGEHLEEGFDPPVSFIFHLSPREMEPID